MSQERAGAPRERQDVPLADYVAIMVRGWKLVLLAVVAFVAVASVYTYAQPKRYRAEASVKLNTSVSSAFRDQRVAVAYINSGQNLFSSAGDTPPESVSIGAAPLSGGHVTLVVEGSDPEGAAKAANTAAKEFVRRSNEGEKALPSALSTDTANLARTLGILERKMGEANYLASPALERQADAANMGTLVSRLSAQREERRVRQEAEMQRATVVVPATPQATPVSPSYKLNLSVAAGIALLLSLGWLSARGLASGSHDNDA